MERDGDGRYRNATESGALLVPDSPDYMAGLGHRLRLWDAWSTLTDAVRAGGTVMDRGVTAQDEQGVRAFIEAMHYRARDHALAVVRAMELDDVEHVLDVGGGSGVYAMAFARVHEGARATVFDLPQVVEITREYVRKEGLEDRVETLAGDYTRDDLGTGYDLVFLSAIVHSNGDEENRQLMRRCASALRPGGQIVIQDFVMTPGRTEPARGALFALNMLVNTPNGDTYTQAEIASWLEAAGFGDIGQSDLPGGVTQIIGRLPRVRES